ncbi:ATP-binding protein [Hufsiella ginkgonis]|uniref:histidine kinase n=1 Tax=Hufsiella ginkgonis TaxID=2695274 RepID=A0A7K1XSK3_9SPHI|nr:ATP-binding protein [Hufsiella ginkgonis]MXV13993.1 response regulator [Hufsiella ginkgonis]
MGEPFMDNEYAVGYWDWDLSGEGELCIPLLKSGLGYQPADFPDTLESWKRLIFPGDWERIAHRFVQHVESRGMVPFACEVRLFYQHGQVMYALVIGKVTEWDAQGNALKVSGTFTNITTQKLERRELIKVSDLLNKTSQAALVGGWEIDVISGEVSWSEGTKNIFEVPWTFKPERGSSSAFFKAGEDREQLLAAFKNAVRHGIPYDLELRVITAKGNEIWTRTIGNPVFENGICTRLYGVFQDITVQKRNQERLETTTAQLNAFIKYAPAAIAIMDKHMNYVALSDVWRKTYGQENADLIGRNHYEMFPQSPAHWKEANKRCLQGEVVRQDEDSFTRMSGKQEWIQWEMRPWYETDGTVGGLIVFTEIITEKKEFNEMLIAARDQAEQATLAKSKFLSVMSHEIRTPMNAVIGFTNLLLQDPRADQQEYLNILKFSGENLMVLINDILDLNKIEAGKIIFEEVEFNIKSLLLNIHASQKQQALEKGLFLEINIAQNIPDYVKGDPVRIGQVVTNLVNNAIKFTSQGKVSLIIRALKQGSDSVDLKIEVVDTGIGIPAEKHQYIFEIFSQASTETTRKYGGTGLGLSITKRLLELMGSEIRLVSAPGAGSSFSFELHLAKATGIFRRKPGDSSNSNGGSLKGNRILIAEDNPVNVILVKQFMKRWDLDFDVAANGKIALEMASGQKYSLILMDIQMPEMDGYEATRRIRSLPGDYYKQLPIIALTASAVSSMNERVFQAGMDDFVSKPFNPDELYGKIDYYLNRNQQPS